MAYILPLQAISYNMHPAFAPSNSECCKHQLLMRVHALAVIMHSVMTLGIVLMTWYAQISVACTIQCPLENQSSHRWRTSDDLPLKLRLLEWQLVENCPHYQCQMQYLLLEQLLVLYQRL